MLAFVVVRCAARYPLLSIDISSAGRPAANLPQRLIAWTGRQTDGQTDATTVPWLCSAYSARSVKRAGSVEDNAEDAVRWELFRCPLVRVTAIITRQPREYSSLRVEMTFGVLWKYPTVGLTEEHVSSCELVLRPGRKHYPHHSQLYAKFDI